MTTLDIRGLDKAELLAALVNAARPFGMGVLADDGQPFTVAEAQRWIAEGRQHDDGTIAPLTRRTRLFFDYVKGRHLKVDLTGDDLNPTLYDERQGDGAAALVVGELRARLASGEPR